MSRLDEFTDEELQSMFNGSGSRFTGWTRLSPHDADIIIEKFNQEITIELIKRRKIIEDEIERNTPRCESCNQRIEK